VVPSPAPADRLKEAPGNADRYSVEQPLTCAKCGRENRPGAVYCWECFAPFRTDEGPAAGPPAASARPLAAVPTVRRATTAPLPPAQVYRGPRTGQHPRRFESAQPKRGGVTARGLLRGLIRIVTIALLLVGGWFGYRWAGTFLGSSFPADIGGIPKSLAGGDDLKATIATWRSETKVPARSQIYSSAVQNNQDAFAVVRVTSVPSGVTAVGLLRQLAGQGSPVKLPASRVHDEQVNGVPYTCATGYDQTTDCLWRASDGGIVLVLGGPSRDYQTALTLTVAAHDAL